MTDILIALALGGLLSLTGVALGGLLVWKTKREPYERFFGGAPKGEVFSIDDLGEEEEEEQPTRVSEEIQRRTDAFVDQFAAGLGED